MTLSTQKKLAQHICRLLKVTDITFPIGRTSKGNFGIVFNENGEWDMMLDSVPLSTKNILTDENNIELKRMVEKYLFEKENPLQKEYGFVGDTIAVNMENGEVIEGPFITDVIEIAPKKKPVSPAKKHGNTKTKKAS